MPQNRDGKGNGPPGRQFEMDERSGSQSGQKRPPARPAQPQNRAVGLLQRFLGKRGPTRPGGKMDLSKSAGDPAVQKKMQMSKFERQRAFDRILGARPTPKSQEEESREEERSISAVAPKVDGKTPGAGLTSRDIWKATFAPVQNKEGRRSAETYRLVIDQFAVGNNPRYQPEAPDKVRSHIFVWDVSRAMNAEIPHFIGTKEMGLGQMVDWLRLEGPMKGWRRVSAQEAIESAQQGMPVVGMPKDPKVKAMAIVRPAPAGPDGQPRFAGAGKKIGNDLGLMEALGTPLAEYFAHA